MITQTFFALLFIAVFNQILPMQNARSYFKAQPATFFNIFLNKRYRNTYFSSKLVNSGSPVFSRTAFNSTGLFSTYKRNSCTLRNLMGLTSGFHIDYYDSELLLMRSDKRYLECKQSLSNAEQISEDSAKELANLLTISSSSILIYDAIEKCFTELGVLEQDSIKILCNFFSSLKNQDFELIKDIVLRQSKENLLRLYPNMLKSNAKRIAKIYSNCKNDGALFLLIALRENDSSIIYVALSNLIGLNKIFNITENKSALINLRKSLDYHSNEDGYTALMLAAQNGHFEAVKHLLELGASVNKTYNNYTALSLARENGHQEIVDLLLKAKEEENKKRETKICILI